MRASQVSCAIAAAVIAIASAPVAAFNCYLLVDRNNEVIYQDALSPVDLSDDGTAAREAMRGRGEQLVVMETENCPAIDRGRVTSKGGPATVEEIVAGMRSALPYGAAVQRTRADTASAGIVLPRIAVPRATGGGMSTSGPPSGMSIR
jgi:hypothetical protein